MLLAIGRSSAGSAAGTPRTHAIESSSVIADASASESPRRRGARAFSERREPPQSGQTPSARNLATRFMPFSSFTFFRAFSTV